MAVQDPLEVAARDLSTAVVSSAAILRINEQNHERCEITHQHWPDPEKVDKRKVEFC
jgi:hypothetical protein